MRERHLLAGIACFVALASAACGGDDEDSGRTPTAAAPPTAPVPGDRSGPQADAPIPGTPEDPEKTAVVDAARAYVSAINRRSAARLCGLLAPGSLAGLDPPRGGPGCRSAMKASIGFADPRGYPQWKRTKIEFIKGVRVDADRARVTMTVFHDFADRRTISNEDDVVHLVKRAGRTHSGIPGRAQAGWRVSKASATLHRAVGKPEVPPDVLLPPRR